MSSPTENPALARLDALVGEWSLTAGPPEGPPWPGAGRVGFEWLEGRRFLIERWEIEMPEAPDGVAIIGPGDERESFRQHYFDSRGVERTYEMTLANGLWKMWRDAPDPFPQRFTAAFEDDDTIQGRWEKDEGAGWTTDFDMTYRRR